VKKEEREGITEAACSQIELRRGKEGAQRPYLEKERAVDHRVEKSEKH